MFRFTFAASALFAAVSPVAALVKRSDHHTLSSSKVHEHELTQRVSVRKPVTDEREYLLTTFDSGLRVMAVHDPEAEKAAFAVAVDAGSLEDPSDFQGLAHFCEHMLFLGSEKYPDKDAFSAELALHGGNHNAYTSSEATVYFNEIGPDGLEKGLDIFAQFFIAPTFDAAMVDKEINAVDSEHKKNMPDTSRRLWHLFRSKANPKNPMHQFSTGDLRTLKTEPEAAGKSLVEALHTFHEKNYCSRRMHLVLVANMTTEEQLALGHKYFDAVPASTDEACPQRPSYLNYPAYNQEQHNIGRHFVLGNTGGSPEMWLMFPMPSLKAHYKQLAEAYVWQVLGHYGPGSLKAQLLKEDLSGSYSFYAENSVAASTIFVTFALTEKGAKNTDKVLDHFFSYFNAVRAAGVDDKLLENVRQLRQVQFDYQEKKSSAFNFVSTVAGALQGHQPEDVLTADVLIDEPDPALITQVMEAVVASNMNVAIVDPFFNEAQANSHEEYYDFGYDDNELDAALIDKLLKATDASMTSPPVLEYVPTDLSLITENSGKDGPEQLIKQGRVESWWLGMGDAKLPKTIISMKVGFPQNIMKTAADSVLGAMHARLVQLALEEPSDALQTCGLSYSCSTLPKGLSLSFSGFNQHIDKLIEMVLPVAQHPEYTEEDFEMVRRQLVLDLADVTRYQPYQHAMEALDLVTLKGEFSRDEMLKALKDTSLVNIETHEKFLADVFAEAQTTLLFTGNVGKARASEITSMIESKLTITRDQPSVSHDFQSLVINPKEEVEIRLANPIAEDPNSATLVAYQFGIPSIADRVHFAMLSEVMDRPVFETLRTEHQLGYVVFGYTTLHADIVEVRVLVQGFRETPDVVEDLIESTVQNLTLKIAAMEQSEFETRKHSLRTTLAKKDSTMGQFAGRYWNQIWDQNYCFNKANLQLSYLDSEHFNSPAPLLEAWKKVVSPSNRRKKISVKLYGSPATGLVEHAGAEKGVKIVTMVDSVSVEKSMEGEAYWPNEYICRDPLAAI